MTSMTVEFDIGDLRALAEGILKDVDEGPALDEQTRVLTHIAVCSAATRLNHVPQLLNYVHHLTSSPCS